MHSTERRLQIFELFKEKKYLSVNELVERFHVSDMTIRRDFSYLEKQGVITVSYGGAALNQGVSSEPSFNLKSGVSQKYKDQIGYEAALLVNDEDSIYVDCGTTPLEMIKYLKDKKVTIITNSYKVVSEVQDFSKNKVILAPGEYDPISEGSLSSSTVSFIQSYLIDKAFISTQGVDLEVGITVPTDNDAQVKKAITACAKTKILLADHTKFNQRFFACHGALEDFDVIISDSLLDKEIIKKMRQKHLNITISRKED